MTWYRIVITRLDDNPKYDADVEARRYRGGYTGDLREEPRQIETEATGATLTEDQWKRVQKVIVEVLGT